MQNEKEVFEEQINLIEEAAYILEERNKIIKTGENKIAHPSTAEFERNSAIAVYKLRSLDLYIDTLSYIKREVIRNEPKNSYFLLPHVRTLLDTYSHFIHLQEISVIHDKLALTCISEQLSVSKAMEKEEEYQKVLSIYKNFLNPISLKFPATMTDYSRTWAKNNGLVFANKKELLTEEKIKKHTVNTTDIFGAKEIYRIYSGFSEYLHGNPYYYVREEHNEKFWVVSTTLQVTVFFIEIIDLYTIKKRNSRDLLLLLSKIKKNKAAFVELWENNRIKK